MGPPPREILALAPGLYFITEMASWHVTIQRADRMWSGRVGDSRARSRRARGARHGGFGYTALTMLKRRPLQPRRVGTDRRWNRARWQGPTGRVWVREEVWER